MEEGEGKNTYSISIYMCKEISLALLERCFAQLDIYIPEYMLFPCIL